MSLKGTCTTADFLRWNDMLILVQKLKQKKPRTALLIAAGCYTGLRISDVLSLHWHQLLDQPHLLITEQKTGKNRRIKLNREFSELARQVYLKLRPPSPQEPVFLNSRRTGVMSVQHINRQFKLLKRRYRLDIDNFSTHTLRKTFGRHIWQQSGYSEKAVTMLSEIFNHSSYRITRRYLGINDQDIDQVYDLL